MPRKQQATAKAEPKAKADAKRKRKDGPSFLETLESETILGSVLLGGQSVLVARRLAFKDGRVALDIRTFVNDRPTAKGIHVREERVPDLLAMIGAVPAGQEVGDLRRIDDGPELAMAASGGAFDPPTF